MEKKQIKLFIYYFIFILLVYMSKNEKLIAYEVWTFLFSHSFETNWFLFIFINLIYLGFILLYKPSFKLVHGLLKLIIIKLKLYKFFNLIIKTYYLVYYYYYKIKQPINMYFYALILKKDKIYTNHKSSIDVYLEHIYNLYPLDIPDINENYFQVPLKRKFYSQFFLGFYKIKIKVQIYGKGYNISLIELCSLLSKMNFNIEYKLNYKNKILNKFFKFMRFYINNQFLYNSMKSNTDFHFYINYPDFKIIPQLFKCELEDHYKLHWYITGLYSKKYIKKFLKIFKLNRFLYIDFIILRLFTLIHKLKKQKNLTLNLEEDNFRIINQKSKFTKLDFNSFYCYFNMFDFSDTYNNILIKNLIQESKIMFKLLKFGFIYLILSQILITSYLNNLLYLYLFFNICNDLFYLLREFDLIRKKNLIKKLIRIAMYQIFYFLFNFNLLVMLFIKSLIILILLSLIFSFYEFNSNHKDIFRDDTLFKYILAYKRVEFNLFYNAYIGFIKLFLMNNFNFKFKNYHFLEDIKSYKYKKNIDIMAKQYKKKKKENE